MTGQELRAPGSIEIRAVEIQVGPCIYHMSWSHSWVQPDRQLRRMLETRNAMPGKPSTAAIQILPFFSCLPFMSVMSASDPGLDFAAAPLFLRIFFGATI